MRLGFPVKVLGRVGLKSHDSRRWRSGPHLSVGIRYLHAILDYLQEERITMYRVSSQIAPYVTHPDLPRFHGQLAECAGELEALGERVRALGLRLSMHPAQYIVLNSPSPEVHDAAVRDLEYHARILDRLGLGPEAVIVIHGGGVYSDKRAAMERFVVRYTALSAPVRARLVVENDEKQYTVPDIHALHERTGIPLVFDNLHHAVNNPDGLSLADAARLCLGTWRSDVTPKVHYSTPRAEPRRVQRRDRKTGVVRMVEAAALAYQHADWIDAEECAAFLEAMRPLAFDVMLEAKQKDLALLRLRATLAERGLAVA